MAVVARWIRLGQVDAHELHAACAGLADVQGADAAPLVIWSQAKTHMCIGQSSTPAGSEPGAARGSRRTTLASRRATLASQGATLAWAEASHYVFVLIAPRRLVPGRTARWVSWALSPAIATYRQFGLPACLDDPDVWLFGQKVAGSAAASIGQCAVIASSFLARFPSQRFADDVACATPEFRNWLREGLSLSRVEWGGHGMPPTERELEEVFRARIEAQYGWQFENSWPARIEAEAIANARVALCGAFEDGTAVSSAIVQ